MEERREMKEGVEGMEEGGRDRGESKQCSMGRFSPNHRGTTLTVSDATHSHRSNSQLQRLANDRRGVE